ncbi:hypothetical protein DFH94DRAFT_698907 [Russula ochroleuca]|uniref:Uncharacterized protein n=1 Tax=Russula ochroleuca TaxID=152965 RepID=A0A9P5JUJ7_9AGAM|nr:hypothetical protein DFH94DRAFT_698907 [Russula ochroleuca]
MFKPGGNRRGYWDNPYAKGREEVIDGLNLELIIVGLVGLIDPLKPDIPDTVRICRGAGMGSEGSEKYTESLTSLRTTGLETSLLSESSQTVVNMSSL